MYIEKLIEEPRHIEIQIVGDSYGEKLAIYLKGLFNPKEASEINRGDTLTFYE